MSASIELRNKRVLVIGLARTGVATALFCAARGARVTATDTRTEKELGDTVTALQKPESFWNSAATARS
jgi:UDP-N-acetylmuramoylalanine--D-glutamate ligase